MFSRLGRLPDRSEGISLFCEIPKLIDLMVRHVEEFSMSMGRCSDSVAAQFWLSQNCVSEKIGSMDAQFGPVRVNERLILSSARHASSCPKL